jgi:hypothetical protein
MFIVQPAQDGNIAVLGNTQDENPSGAISVSFYPSFDFTGSFAVVGRPPGISTSDTSVPWQAIPYRLVSLQDVASDYSFKSDTINTAAIIHVPANGLAVGLLVACSAGTTQLWIKPMYGATSP